MLLYTVLLLKYIHYAWATVCLYNHYFMGISVFTSLLLVNKADRTWFCPSVVNACLTLPEIGKVLSRRAVTFAFHL